MKHQTINLVKFKALSKRLGQPMCHTVGYLETLWIFCQIQARDGDLSRFSEMEIAGWIEYPGDPGDFIAALVECRWLDSDGDILTVHNWADHRPNWLKGVQAKEQPGSGPGKPPRSGTRSATKVADLSGAPPNLTQPNPTKPNPTKPIKSDFETFWQSVNPKIAKEGCRKHYERITKNGQLEVIVSHIQARWEIYAKSPKAKSDYAWEPLAWLRDGHYEDDPESWNRLPPINGKATYEDICR